MTSSLVGSEMCIRDSLQLSETALSQGVAIKPQQALTAPLLAAHTQRGLLSLPPDDTALMRH
eukprot:11380920-Prorocentrum_lima.AAC.1